MVFFYRLSTFHFEFSSSPQALLSLDARFYFGGHPETHGTAEAKTKHDLVQPLVVASEVDELCFLIVNLLLFVSGTAFYPIFGESFALQEICV